MATLNDNCQCCGGTVTDVDTVVVKVCCQDPTPAVFCNANWLNVPSVVEGGQV